jgi:hypothetical protein
MHSRWVYGINKDAIKNLLAQSPVGSGSGKNENDLQGQRFEHGFRTLYDGSSIISGLATEPQKEISSRHHFYFPILKYR